MSLAELLHRGRHDHGRHKIVVGTPAEDWFPGHPLDVPPAMFGLQTLPLHYVLGNGLQAVRDFNQEQLDGTLPVRQWALIVFLPRGGRVEKGGCQ